MLLLFLYALWIAFNARVTADVALAGIPAAALVYLFCLKCMGLSVRKDFLLLRRLPALLSFLASLLRRVILSALRVMRLIWTPRTVEPQLLRYDPGLRTSAGRILWADSITLTPGTITVVLESGGFAIHCLDVTTGEGLWQNPVLRKIRSLEGGAARG